jgi:prepilin-type N-terminal cleavage/methylation domain-containing protein
VPTRLLVPRDAAGFTLIEVLVAMIILAVGLLGLEALGIGAARAVSLAEKQSQYSTVASHHLEVALDSLRIPAAVGDAKWTNVPYGGDVVQRTVTPTADPTGTLYTVSISVTPNPGTSLLRPSPFTLVGSAYVAP